MNLYELTDNIATLSRGMETWAEEHEGDVTEFPGLALLEALDGEKEQKILGLGAWYKNLEAEAEAIRAEEVKLAARRKALTARSERVKSWMASFLDPGQKLADGRCALSWRRSEQVLVTCLPDLLPIEYQRITVEARKTELKNALKSGKTVEGVELVPNMNLQIK